MPENCLKQVLKQRGWSLARAEEELEIHASALSHFSRGDDGYLSLNKVLWMADELNISLDDLFLRNDRKFNKIKGVTHE